MSASYGSRNRSTNGQVLSNYRSISPSGRFYSGGAAYSSSSSSSFASSSSSSFFRSASPTRVNLAGTGGSARTAAATVRFSLDRPTSPGRSLSFAPANGHVIKRPISAGSGSRRRTCMCSPTNHPGSFRCSLHKNQPPAVQYSSNRLNARRSAMTNSLVRIGTVEGDLVKRALAALIRPSSHQQRRRAAFQPRPSRLSAMSRAADDL
ncbi:uncharacterized protein M6B38_134305 [Iris pallida]|uniref:Serine-rich protein-like protein n=1 Tax=Iris pallida TaxID=29817 RepID=A0AAX6DWI1_IRIPA|nr:uncharacterized protein M6B38_221640 [Iris pallida]KAJ6815357.1 uncharacterized protein M6B38_134305 [Iris pallida]